MSTNVDAVRRLFAAVEARDLDRVLACYHDDVEINEAAWLPYGGVYRGRDGAVRHAEGFVEAWGLHQTETEYPLDAAFAETEDGEVVAVFRHRAVDRAHGERLDTPEIGIYEVRDGKVARTQMFHFDHTAVNRFLARAAAE